MQSLRERVEEMKPLMLAFAIILMAGSAFADVYVSGYTRSDGTYVSPHYRSSPNSSQYDNWSSKGNTNPYTGTRGTLDPSSRGDFGSQYQYKPMLGQ